MLVGCGTPQEVRDLWDSYERDLSVIRENETSVRESIIEAFKESEAKRHRAGLLASIVRASDAEGRLSGEKVLEVLGSYEEQRSLTEAEIAALRKAAQRVAAQWDSAMKDHEVFRRQFGRTGLSSKDIAALGDLADE